MTSTLRVAIAGRGRGAGRGARRLRPGRSRWRRGRAMPPRCCRRFRNRPVPPRRDPASTLEVAELAGGLEHPWGMALLPDGAVLVTERPGRMRIVGSDGTVSEPLAGLPAGACPEPGRPARRGGRAGVRRGPDGLLDLFQAARRRDERHRRGARPALRRPQRDRGGGRHLRAGAAVADADALRLARGSSTRIGTCSSPPASIRAPAERVLAQDLATGYGKVMRLRPDGSAPPDNPFVGEPGRQSRASGRFGHRNVQGAAIHPRVGRALDHRARAEGRRRAEPPGPGLELRLAGGQLRRQLQRLAGRRAASPRRRTSRSRSTSGIR